MLKDKSLFEFDLVEDINMAITLVNPEEVIRRFFSVCVHTVVIFLTAFEFQSIQFSAFPKMQVFS